MKKWGYVVVLLALGAAACWKTKPNPRYCEEGGACDGGMSMDGGGGDMVVRCVDASSCSGSTPFCDASSGVCRACGASDCTTPQICDTTPGDPGIGQCVECVVDSDCGGELCQSNKCVPCTKHTDCAKTTGICDIDGGGKCAPAADIIYVDNVMCTTGTKDGTSESNAFCQVNDALPHVNSTLKFVKVAGNGNQHIYNAIVWSGSTALIVDIVGPGKTASLAGNGAVFSETSKPALLLQPTADATFTADGLELIGANASPEPGVSCSGTGGTVTLTVRDCYTHESGAQGIVSNACALTVDRSLLKNNNGALTVSGGSFNVQNSVFIGGQTTAAVPISLNTTNVGTFSFNTVVQNTTSGAAVGGIDCGSSTTQTILASIVSGNTMQGATQFGPKCALTSTVVGSTDMTTGGIKVDPVFQSDGYHLVVGSNPDIVNQLTSGPAFDIDDIARPINAKWDIGADEAE